MDKLGFGMRLRRMQLAKREIMNEIAHNSLEFFKVKSFDNEGFTDKTLERWPARKDGDTSRRLLVKTGRGRASIHIQSVNADSAKLVAEAEYMRYHNEGTKTIPKREFMGDSQTLNGQNKKIIDKHINRVL